MGLRSQRGKCRLGIEIDQRVPADVDRLDPLGVRAQGDAGHPGKVRLLLDASGIGQHRARSAEQRGELGVAQRLGHVHPLHLDQIAPTPDRHAGALACAGERGTPRGQEVPSSRSTSLVRRAGSSTLPARCAVSSRYSCGCTPRFLARSAVLSRAVGCQRRATSTITSPTTSTLPEISLACGGSQPRCRRNRAGARSVGRSRSGCAPRASSGSKERMPASM